MDGDRLTGTVKWFDAEKGYGFIKPDHNGDDLFIHYTGIQGNGYRSLTEGAKVEYATRQGRKGVEAFDAIQL